MKPLVLDAPWEKAHAVEARLRKMAPRLRRAGAAVVLIADERLEGMVRALARELAPEARINAIVPGNAPKAVVEEAVDYLSGPRSAFVTGQTIRIG